MHTVAKLLSALFGVLLMLAGTLCFSMTADSFVSPWAFAFFYDNLKSGLSFAVPTTFAGFSLTMASLGSLGTKPIQIKSILAKSLGLVLIELSVTLCFQLRILDIRTHGFIETPNPWAFGFFIILFMILGLTLFLQIGISFEEKSKHAQHGSTSDFLG
jgi:hypothetical protein